MVVAVAFPTVGWGSCRMVVHGVCCASDQQDSKIGRERRRSARVSGRALVASRPHGDMVQWGWRLAGAVLASRRTVNQRRLRGAGRTLDDGAIRIGHTALRWPALVGGTFLVPVMAG